MCYYAVACGRRPGIYKTWQDCQAQVSGYSRSKYMKFYCYGDAKCYLHRQRTSSWMYNCGKLSDDQEKCCTFYAVTSGRYPGIYTYDPDEDSDLEGEDCRIYFCAEDARRYMSRRRIYNYNDNCECTCPEYDQDGRARIYVDGACSNNGYRGAQAGIGVYFGDDHPLNVSEPVQGSKATNIVAETQSVIEACRIAKKYSMKKIRIYTDSDYIIKCVNVYRQKWYQNGWVNSRGQTVANKELLQELDELMDDVDVVFKHVRAHSGIYGNEMADKLARAGAEEY